MNVVPRGFTVVGSRRRHAPTGTVAVGAPDVNAAAALGRQHPFSMWDGPNCRKTRT